MGARMCPTDRCHHEVVGVCAWCSVLCVLCPLKRLNAQGLPMRYHDAQGLLSLFARELARDLVLISSVV